MKLIRDRQDYYIYIYGLKIADIGYKESESLREIRIPREVSMEVEIMKDQLLSNGFFSVEIGKVIDIPVEYSFVDEIGGSYIYKVDDPIDEIFNGTNAHAFVIANQLLS